MRRSFRGVWGCAGALALAANLAGCSGPEKFYSGDRLPEDQTALFVGNGSPVGLRIDGQPLSSVGEAALLPGTHRIVLLSYMNPARYGFLELDAEAGRTYSARMAAAEGHVWSWAVDTGSCAVVAGQTPVAADEMTPVELGCEKPKHEIKPGRVLLGIALLPVVVAGLGVYVAAGAPPIIDARGQGCGDDCYGAFEAGDEPVATLLIPARDGGCQFRRLFPGNSTCTLAFSIDGFTATEDARSFAIRPGRRGVVFKAGFTRRGLAPFRGTRTDGIALEAEAGEVYALCQTIDKKGAWFWIVNNATGEVVAGPDRDAAPPEKPSDYSPYCPAY